MIDIKVRDDVLIVRGEKRFEREARAGHRVGQTIPVPAAVTGQDARASYRNGVLKIDLPKAEMARRPRTIEVKPAQKEMVRHQPPESRLSSGDWRVL